MFLKTILSKQHLFIAGLGLTLVGCQYNASQVDVPQTISTPTGVTEIIHGVEVADPYRFLEEESDATHA